MRKCISSKKSYKFYLRVNFKYYLFQFSLQIITVKNDPQGLFFSTDIVSLCAATTILQKAKPKLN